MIYKSWNILILGYVYFIDLCNCQKPCTVNNLKSDLIKKEAQQLPLLKMEMQAKGININTVIAVDSKAERVSAHVPGITVDSAEIWSALGQHNGHIFVFDKCKRLAYEVIMPWSHHRNPFVKAAILSAFHSPPCGPCPLGDIFLKKEFYYKKNTGILQYPPTNGGKSLENVILSQSSDENSINIPPMRIIFSQQHKHKDDSNMYNYIELLADDPSYHKHPEDEDQYFFTNSPLKTINEEADKNELNDDHKSTNSHKQLLINGGDEVPTDNPAHNASDYIMTKEKLWSHYSNILLWLPHV